MKKKKRFKIWPILLIAFLFVGCALILGDDEEGADYAEGDGNSSSSSSSSSSGANINLSDIEEGEGTATVLIYMIGSDLESQSGCATQDIQEMCNANLDNVNVVIQTGGSTYWANSAISANKVQRFIIEDGELVLLEDLGKVSMVKESTLSDFLKWGTENYSADTVDVILWDHGGGTIGGFGSDELYPDGNLSIDQIASAFSKVKTKFNFIGFDACLMATIETAYVLSPYADYLIASEETEPGTGWYYTNWLSGLSKNPVASPVQIGSLIVKDFINGPDASFWDDTTLAVIDLEKIPDVYDKLCAYLGNSRSELYAGGYQGISRGRSKAKAFGDGDYEQIDIVDYLSYVDIDGAAELKKSISEAVVVFDTTISNTHGLAMYYPYEAPDYYDYMSGCLNNCGLSDDEYEGFFDDFMSMLVNGYDDDYSYSPAESMCGTRAKSPVKKDYSKESWYNADAVDPNAGKIELNADGELTLEEKGEGYVLKLSDEQWDLVTYAELQVLYDDGEGFVDLGGDNVYEFDDDGDLIVDYDYTWVSLNGQIVPYYAEGEDEKADGSYSTYGYVPAELTKKSDGSVEEIEIMLYWDDAHPDGYVAGYRLYTPDDVKMYQRNLMTFEKGDEIEFVCDYYDRDGEYNDSYYFGDKLVVDGELKVSYEEMEECTTWVYYYLKDIYQNEYYTETLEFSFE